MAHNHPDPDAIASGWAIAHLVKKTLHLPTSLVSGGEIVRAENRLMVSLLRPPLKLNRPLPCSKDTLLVLVDCDVKTTNHPAIDPAQPVAVLDHHVGIHRNLGDGKPVFEDKRPKVAATTTIAASYLKEQGVLPPINLATALVYGIRTETKAGQTGYSELDRQMLTWAMGLANPSFVAQIEDAPLGLPYFSDLALALQNTFVYGHSAFCILPQSHGPEIVGEVADLLVRCSHIKNVFCGAVYQDRLVVSVRTEDASKDAARIVVKVLEGKGSGGGHPHRAGGMIQVFPRDRPSREAMYRHLRTRWLAACNALPKRGRRLVARSKIVTHL
jgi:nanoRNase/pAp phosphatase (c-di-AMP/oligoRNAs hydrolase)